jgi:cytochrome c553
MTRSAARFALIALLGQGAASAALAQDSEALACATCHHPTGSLEGRAALRYEPYPQIAGLPARYIARQLHAYRSGMRDHALMGYVAGQLSDADIARWARAYAAAKTGNESRQAATTQTETVNELGQSIALGGVWERGVPSCESCHAQGEQRPPLSPALAGKSATYILGELRAYATGTRAGDPMGRMRAYASRLTDEEMAAVAEHYGNRSRTRMAEDSR